MRPEEQALEAHQHTLFRDLKNAFFNRNLDQNVLKNAYFFEKKAVKLPQRQGIHPQKFTLASGGWDSALRPPRCYSQLLT